MWRGVPSGTTGCLAACVALLACSHEPRGGVRSGALSAGTPIRPDAFVAPARFLPDVTPSSTGLVDVLPDGSRRLIVSGIRVVDHPDGSIERAREVLPSGSAKVVPLPSRIGGGLVVYIVSTTGTQVWRTKSWLGNLEPLAETWGAVDEITAGFDRLYVRMTSGDVRAIDPDSGRQVSLGPLPPATRIRTLAFADAWRAVAIVDFRGALATFDAGNTWRTVPLDGLNVNQVALREGDFLLDTPRGRFVLGPGGEMSRDDSVREAQRPSVGSPTEGTASSERTGFSSTWDPRGLGMRPIRAAVEGGWPVGTSGGERAAVFAHGGTLYRVGLESGAVLEVRRGALREDDGACQAIAVGRGFGFVCGVQAGPTAVYAVEPTLDVREVVRFARARAIVPSGNGGFVVRGICSRDGPATVGATPAFCSFSPAGEEKQWKSPTMAYEETPWIRPVVLRDGRVVFVSPPTDTSSGKLFVSRGADFDAVPLAFDDRKVGLRRTYLLEGIEEREPGVLGAWVLLGEEVRGARIALDGKVSLGVSPQRIDRTIVSGRFGFDWAGSGRGFETFNGGMTWMPVDLPAFDPSRAPRSVAACGPVGCARDNWLRIGWGRMAETTDLVPARAPERSRVTLTPPRGVSLRCQPTGEVAGPATLSPKVAVETPKRKPKPAPPGAVPAAVRGIPRVPFSPFAPPPVARPAPADVRGSPAGQGPTWSPFRGQAPPALGSGEVALEAGTDPPMSAQARIYTWGIRGAEWAHSGHVQARFDDRFELSGIRSSAVTAPPWSDEDRASDALGLTAGQPVNWSSLLDPSGQAAVLVGQRGGGRADLVAAAAGEPLVFWRDVDNGPLPAPSSVVRAGATWFFLHSAMAQNTWASTVYRVDGGVVRRLARLPRIPVPAGEFAPRLMRRARSKGLGLLVQGAPGFDQVIRDWYVLPIDPDTGELDEPVRLYGSDLEGRMPEACPDERDGWMVNTELSLAPAVRIITPTPVSLSAIELRLRLDPGSVCVDAIAARADGLVAPSAHHPPPPADPGDLPLAATDTTSGRRWLLRCGL